MSEQGRKEPDPLPSSRPIPQPQYIFNNSYPYHQDILRRNAGVVPSYVDYATLQASMQAMSEGILKAALKEGVLRQDIPTLPPFTGKTGDGKPAWRRWELQIKTLVGVYSEPSRML